MCDIWGIESQYFAFSGLSLDLIGVVLLGVDLIRVQSNIKIQATADIKILDDFSEKYGGLDSWISDIKKQTRYVKSYEYSDHDATDETTFNIDAVIYRQKELSEVQSAFNEYIIDIMNMNKIQYNNNKIHARRSLALSYWGLAFVAVGFALQLVATSPWCL